MEATGSSIHLEALDSTDKATSVELVGRAKTGDRQAFAAIYRDNVGWVRSYVASKVFDSEKVEDIVAEVFVRVLRNISRFEDRGVDFGAWLNRIARNLVIDHLKSSATTREVLQDVSPDRAGGADTESLAFALMEADRLRVSLSRLHPTHRRILELRFVRGLTGGETAKLMGRTEAAVRVCQYRALQALRREFKPEELRVAG
jgi:RNA polymerase sigma-70 factor (ECF subfamily)